MKFLDDICITQAPNAQEFFDETVDRISPLHMYHCLRYNKATSAWGVEPRVPFLDADFLNTAMNINTEEKMIKKGTGWKCCICKAFDTPDDFQTTFYGDKKNSSLMVDRRFLL